MEGSTLCLAMRSITIIDNKSRFGFRRRSVRGLVIGSSSSCSTKSSQTATATITASASASSNSVGLSRQRRAQNVQGEFFVDQTCIDCDTCRWMAPQTFTRVDAKSAVIKQPSSEEERVNALQALLSCPTSSIHTEKPPEDIVEVHKTFPIPINKQRIPGVYHCGYHSEKSYGATSYFIVHPEGNILVDSPRYTEKLARNIEMLGGARYMFLTHSDDVADHDQWSKRLMCDRILHLEEVEATTADVEMKLDGCGPWNLGKDFELIHTPGHTAVRICLLALQTAQDLVYRGSSVQKRTWNEYYGTIQQTIRYGKKWSIDHQSVSVQLNSVMKLLDLDFEWIIPGHGRIFEFRDIQEKNAVLEAFLALKEQAQGQFV